MESLVARLQSVAEGAESDLAMASDEAFTAAYAVALAQQLGMGWSDTRRAEKAVAEAGHTWRRKPANADLVCLDLDQSASTLLALQYHVDQLKEHLPEHAQLETGPIIDDIDACLGWLGRNAFEVTSPPPPVGEKTSANLTDLVLPALGIATRLLADTVALTSIEDDVLTVRRDQDFVAIPIDESLDPLTLATMICLQLHPELHDNPVFQDRLGREMDATVKRRRLAQQLSDKPVTEN